MPKPTRFRRFRFLPVSFRDTESAMSDQEENTERRIVEVPSSALLIREEREKSPILSEMVSAALVVAAETGLANLSAEELIRIGKTFYLKDGPGATDANIKAFSFFYQAAQQEHPEAEYLVYSCISNGDGVSFDYPISIQWLRKAAYNGSLEAVYKYAIYHILGGLGVPNWKEGISLLEFAANHNHPPSQNALGVIYVSTNIRGFESEIRLTFKRDYGRNLVDVPYSKSEIDYFIQNAKSDPKDGGWFLGKLYYFGLLDNENNYARIQQLIEAAAKLDNTYALLTIAYMYAGQDCIDKHLSREERINLPRKWRERAATLGNIEAKHFLGIEKLPEVSTEQRKEFNDRGMFYLKKSADNHNPFGLYNFGRFCCKHGFGTIEDSNGILLKAANQGVDQAWFCLAKNSESEIELII